MGEWRKHAFPAGLMLAGLSLLFIFLLRQDPASDSVGTPASMLISPATATVTPEPIIPTVTGHATNVSVVGTSEPPPPLQVPVTEPTSSAQLLQTPGPLERAAQAAPELSEVRIAWRKRFGISGSLGDMRLAVSLGLPFGRFFNWKIAIDPFSTPGVEFWQTIRLTQEGMRPRRQDLSDAILANPGSVWVVGNEPDVIWQDNVTAERYATLYEEAYRFIKSRDPSASIAIAGVAQSTPLRRAYLDEILRHYRSLYGHDMPIDIWTVHAYILREEAGSWGVDIPPGMEQRVGELYEITDHDDITLFRQNIIDFRGWMLARGYGDRPLVVTEFGIIMPADYGFPEDVRSQFMTESLGFLSSAVDDSGFAADGGRLVQGWFWYSLYDPPDRYPSGNLLNRQSRELTALGRTWKGYVEAGR